MSRFYRRSLGSACPKKEYRSDLDGLEVPGDACEISRAAMNVVSNAVEHASERVSVSLRAEGGILEIEVADDGSGFSPEALERGCERFFQGDPSRAGAHHGLGLYAASEALRRCGGEIGLSNDLARDGAVQGARVVLSIPLAFSPNS